MDGTEGRYIALITNPQFAVAEVKRLRSALGSIVAVTQAGLRADPVHREVYLQKVLDNATATLEATAGEGK